jgi:flagellar M-ring protein FliF
MIDQLTLLVRGLTISQRIGILFGSLFSVLLLVGLVMWAGAPQLQPAFTRLSTADAATIGDALDSAGIPYELADAGATIKVPAAQLAAARVAAGGAGFSSDGVTGFELFDKQGFGASEFDQQVTYQRALEGKLTKTILKLDGVEEATVSIVAAETGVLAGSDRPASASIYIRMGGGRRPSASLVQGIVLTVATSVSGLTSSNVTVVDADGTVLAGPDDAASTALTIQGTVERTLAAKVQALVDTALGPGHASVAVSALLDLDKVEKQVRTVQPITSDNNTPTSWQTSGEVYGQGAASGAGGIPGTTSNVPGLPSYPSASASPGASAGPGASASPSPDYAKWSQTVNYANSETVATIVQQPGAVRRLSVAVLLDQGAMGGNSAESLKAAISAAIGADDARKDVVSVNAVSFAAAAAAIPETGPDLMAMVSQVVPTVGGALLALVLVFLVWRNMRALRGRAETMQLAATRLQVPALGAGGELSPALAAAAAAAGRIEMAELPSINGAQARIQERIRVIAEDKPDELVGLVNTWLREDDRAKSR